MSNPLCFFEENLHFCSESPFDNVIEESKLDVSLNLFESRLVCRSEYALDLMVPELPLDLVKTSEPKKASRILFPLHRPSAKQLGEADALTVSTDRPESPSPCKKAISKRKTPSPTSTLSCRKMGRRRLYPKLFAKQIVNSKLAKQREKAYQRRIELTSSRIQQFDCFKAKLKLLQQRTQNFAIEGLETEEPAQSPPLALNSNDMRPGSKGFKVSRPSSMAERQASSKILQKTSTEQTFEARGVSMAYSQRSKLLSKSRISDASFFESEAKVSSLLKKCRQQV